MNTARHRPTSSRLDCRLIATAVVVAVVALTPADLHPQNPPESAVATAADIADRAAALDREVSTLRESTARFKDVEVALAEGYVRDPMNLCISAPIEGYPAYLGGMGIHFFRPDLLGLTATEPRVAGTGTHTDFSSPGVLIYFPDEDGALHLGALENLVFMDAWQRLGNSEAPQSYGHEYWTMIDNPATPEVDEAHMFEPHYELHLWVHKENPLGIAMPFNPSVSCADHRGPKTVEEGIEWAKAHAAAPSDS